MKDAYKKLTKIKRPVLIEVISKCYPDNRSRYRILYPNGTCYYARLDKKEFTLSCFSKSNLLYTIENMYKFDNTIMKDLKITKFQPL